MTDRMKELAKFDKYEADLVAFEQKLGKIVYDMSDPEQAKQARADKSEVIKVIDALDAVHKAIKAPLKELTDKVDHARKSKKDRLIVLKERIHAQQKKYNEQVKFIQAQAESAYQEVLDLGVFPPEGLTSAQISERIAILDNIVIDTTFLSYEQDAIDYVAGLKTSLPAALNKAKEQEDKDAELEKLRENQREADRITAESEAREKAEEKAEQDRIEREKRLQLEKEAAERKAEEDKEAAVKAERERLEQEAKDREDERLALEAKEKADQEAKEANTIHCAKIHSAMMSAFIEAGHDQETAKQIVTVIAQRKIPHVTINY